MKKQKTFFISISVLILITLFTSCLKQDLPDYPAWNGNYINNVFVEYRWEDRNNLYNGKPVVAYQKLQVEEEIDSSKNMINIQITVPAVSGTFTADVRNNVSQNHLWMYSDISTAATVAPTGNTPKLGDPADLTQPQTYVVTAANGQKRTWTIKVTSFIK